MCLKVVTPINISDGIVLGAKDYLYDSRRQKVFFLNLHQWHMFIYKHMLLEKYESYLANFRDKQSLLEWLQMQGYDIDDVRTVITSEAQATVNLMDNEKKKTLNDINRHIQQPDGSLYVPGSSIKGVFRTAILYSLLQKRQDIKVKYWRQIQEKISSNYFKPYRDFNKLISDLENEFLHTLRLVDGNIRSNNAVCSVMRGLQVSDTYASRNMQTAILQKLMADLTSLARLLPKNFRFSENACFQKQSCSLM